MIATAKNKLVRFQRRWQLELVVETLLYAAGPALLTYVLSKQWLVALGLFLVVFGIALALQKPWKLHLRHVSSYIDGKLDAAAFSSSLVLLSTAELSGLARLQQRRIAVILTEKMGTIRPKIDFFKAIFSLIFFLLISFLVYQFGYEKGFFSDEKLVSPQEKVIFQVLDSAAVTMEPPVLESQKITIRYPAYTNIAPFSTSKMDVQVLEGSRLRWNLEFDQPVDSVSFEFSGTRSLMYLKNKSYSYSKTLDVSGFYNFRFTDSLGAAYASDLYSVELLTDQSPVIALDGLQPFISFDFDDKKQLHFSTLLSDDFGIGEAHITATVSRGTGESVKFREARLDFDNSGKAGEKKWQLSKKINLDSLEMEPGDELYFYVEVADLKSPTPNISRSETFFAVIKDTVSYDYAVEGTLGVDRMPDYFRSQRQLIIDTEKLIKNKPKLSVKEFDKTSNELGIEQSALRLKYGKFMGDENAGAEDHEHQGEENPIADYMHNHDSNNEHNLVEKDSEQAKKDTTKTKKPDQFTQSLHSKMRQALNEMWDSERHLRVNEPQQSLPYQHRALDLLQEIKNSARIYVHRIGFDPPPIKENTRLSGDIKDVDNYRKTAALEKPEIEPNMRKAVAVLEQIFTENKPISDANRSVFDKAGNELAQKAIDEPGAYLGTLQQLKWLSESHGKPKNDQLRSTLSGLLRALENPNDNPNKRKESLTKLNTLLLQELERND
ncbi:MAG TPA: tryptophan-rich sensory protein [Leeuwenhoekiella sp.]|nr:tryptophan-rich sensory protein [Leeuwenhoekiella sp.]